MRSKSLEFIVGIFMLIGLAGLALLAFKVSGLTEFGNSNYYRLNAQFDNIGGLKVRAPVTVSGVKIGQVASIRIDPKTFRANVVLNIEKNMNDLPVDTSARILTQGLLGSNYISLTPGFSKAILKPGGEIETTHSALILENLVGQIMYSLKGDKK